MFLESKVDQKRFRFQCRSNSHDVSLLLFVGMFSLSHDGNVVSLKQALWFCPIHNYSQEKKKPPKLFFVTVHLVFSQFITT